ncbi:MAG: hypothetical protein JWQ10_1070 [Herbaspirillum sp.]|nr:hypothetical protein [Herbaspirillum sp.]
MVACNIEQCGANRGIISAKPLTKAPESFTPGAFALGLQERLLCHRSRDYFGVVGTVGRRSTQELGVGTTENVGGVCAICATEAASAFWADGVGDADAALGAIPPRLF